MVDTINGTNSTQIPLRSSTQPESGRESLSSDFDTFLRMLTVQVENQDPLNPVDSTDYATQLATFSSVEQQVLTNDLLKDLGAALGGTVLQQAGAWIGMEGLVRAPASFDQSGPITVYPKPAEGADRATLVVRDSFDQIVERIEIEIDGSSFEWEGRDASGSLQPSGLYRFDVESYSGEDLIETGMAAVYSRINEVRSSSGEVMVRVADGTELPAGLIDGLRSAQ